MQIDFHHAATYVIARFAGFTAAEAKTIAHAAQYVDDAVESGTVEFDNGAMYQRISSAHKMLDYRNFEALASHLVWVPFHFLPGNAGLEAGQDPDGSFINKLVCRPDSLVARDMLRACIAQRNAPYGLHRLGITMHVYADTWAHQGFAGVSHLINQATGLAGPDGSPDQSTLDKLENFFISRALPLGHGAVLGQPDRPYLVWSYTNGLGQRILRNNPKDFVEAADAMCRAMQRFIIGDPDAVVAGMRDADRARFTELIVGLHDPDATVRHRKWLAYIAKGVFGFGPETVEYVETGPGSWKHTALGDKEDGMHKYTPAFLTSDWKRFHDALQQHRFDVIHHILPTYGICVA
jgi:hypothetical protein